MAKRAYRMSADLRERINQIWYSEKLGRTYSSEKRMRAAEAASERRKAEIFQKGGDIIYSISKKLPIDWEELGSLKNAVSHQKGESIIAELFYNSDGESDSWDKLTKSRFLSYYRDNGWEADYGDGLNLYNFILYVLPSNKFSEEQEMLTQRQSLERYQQEI